MRFINSSHGLSLHLMTILNPASKQIFLSCSNNQSFWFSDIASSKISLRQYLQKDVWIKTFHIPKGKVGIGQVQVESRLDQK